MYYAIVHTQVRDDDPYIDEWVCYHLTIGFEHIVIWDHLSARPVENVWGERVTVIRETRPVVDPLSSNETLKQFPSYWLMPLDVDEFVVLHKHNDVKDLLQCYEAYGGLGINWAVYGSGRWVRRPEGRVMNNYLWRVPYDYLGSGPQHLAANNHVKTIINTKYCTGITNPHTCHSVKPLVNEDFVPYDFAFSDSSRTLCRINHYCVRSYEEWLFKMHGGPGYRNFIHRPMTMFEDINLHATIYDPVLKDFKLNSYGIL